MKDIIYAFIDGQNLNYGIKKDIYRGNKIVYRGWKLDYKKFRIYLKNKFKVQKAFYFIGYAREYEDLYKDLRNRGYNLIFKPTVKTKDGYKGNVDAELVLHSAKVEYNNYDKAIFISGDGDFRCLYEELEKDKKLLKILIPNYKSASSLLLKFQKYEVFLEFEKNRLKV